MSYAWTGHYLSPCGIAVAVKYYGPTNTRGSRWVATLRRSDVNLRAAVPFDDGPIAAINALRHKHADLIGGHIIHSVGAIDPDTYAVILTP